MIGITPPPMIYALLALLLATVHAAAPRFIVEGATVKHLFFPSDAGEIADIFGAGTIPDFPQDFDKCALEAAQIKDPDKVDEHRLRPRAYMDGVEGPIPSEVCAVVYQCDIGLDANCDATFKCRCHQGRVTVDWDTKCNPSGSSGFSTSPNKNSKRFDADQPALYLEIWWDREGDPLCVVADASTKLNPYLTFYDPRFKGRRFVKYAGVPTTPLSQIPEGIISRDPRVLEAKKAE